MNRIALTVARSLVAALAATTLAPAAATADPIFATAIGTPVGGPEGNCSGLGSTQSSAPTAATGQCASPAQLHGSAAALFGHVGAGSDVEGFPGYFGSGFGIASSAEFRDTVTFTADPDIFTGNIATVALNLQFSGVLEADSFGSAFVDLFVQMAGFYALHAATNGTVTTSLQVINGTLSSGVSSAHLRTGSGQFFLSEPQPLVMRIGTGAAAFGSGSARSDFSNSFAIPFGMDVFVLPPGVTANAGTWLVNNRRVDPNVVPDPPNVVPEPSIWALMLAGFGMARFTLRRRNGSWRDMRSRDGA